VSSDNRKLPAFRRHPILSAGLTLTAVLAVASTFFADRQIVINTSPSVQPGIYIRSCATPKVGAIVDFEIPTAAQPYIQARSGYSGENWYILKAIIAGPGDQVDTLGGWLIVNEKRIAPMPPREDIAGRPLPIWRGCRRLADDEFFVFSARIPNSFDSRCYGPIPRREIMAVRWPLITW
jgi:conjugative transfer signal peptidase TraF